MSLKQLNRIQRGIEMDAELKTERGKSWLEVFYHTSSLDYDQAIRAGLDSYGLRPGQIPVIAYPRKAAST
jgi:hypothetical protein